MHCALCTWICVFFCSSIFAFCSGEGFPFGTSAIDSISRALLHSSGVNVGLEAIVDERKLFGSARSERARRNSPVH